MKREALKKRLVFADILVKLHKHTKKAGAFWDFGGRISEIVAENVKKGEENVTRVGRLWQICRKRGEMSRERRRYGGRERRRGQRRAAWGKRGAAWGGAGAAQGGAGEARGGAGEGAEGVGGVWVREGAGRCRGSAGRRGGSAGRCRGSALPHAAQAAGDGGSRTVPVRPEKEAVGDPYPLLRAVPGHQPIQETSVGGWGAASQQEPRPNVCPWGPFGRGRFEDKRRGMYFRPAQGRRKYRQGAIPPSSPRRHRGMAPAAPAFTKKDFHRK